MSNGGINTQRDQSVIVASVSLGGERNTWPRQMVEKDAYFTTLVRKVILCNVLPKYFTVLIFIIIKSKTELTLLFMMTLSVCTA